MTTPQPPGTPPSRIDELNKDSKKGWSGTGRMMGNVLGTGFVGVDTYMRVKDGESLPVALGTALLTNAAFSLLPGGILGATAAMGAMMTPQIMAATDGARQKISKKATAFSKGFEQNETQMAFMESGLGRMEQARMKAVRKMAGHARGAARPY